MEKQDLIVFDMDGVLIDVSKSYRDVVRQTTRLFFKETHAWKVLPEPLFSLSDLGNVKQSGGLNNDWDLTSLVISLLISLVEINSVKEDTNPWSLYNKAMRRCDVSRLAQFLDSEDRPLTTLMKTRGKDIDPFVGRFYVNEVGSGNVVKQIFQEIYLGKDLFESTYNMPVKIYHGEGYINREKLLIERTILDELSNKKVLAIATGRPKIEADFTLDLFCLKQDFSIIYTLDDCIREEKRIMKQENRNESLSKPNPYMLDAISATRGNAAGKNYYVGDMPDDMIAASRAKAQFKGIGFIGSAPEKERSRKALSQAGADYIIESFDELKTLVAIV